MENIQGNPGEKLNMNSVSLKGFTWIDITPPTDKEIEYLAENYHFHHLDLDDTLSRRQRPKIDEYKDYLFLVFHFPIYSKKDNVLTSSQISVFIGQDYLITLHKGVLKPLVKLFRECEIDEESREEYLGQGAGFLLYRILDRLVDYCQPILNKVSDGIEDVEDDIFSESRGTTIREISRLRRDVIAFRRIIWPMRAVVGRLEAKSRRFMALDMSAYFGDMVDHLDRIWDGLDEYKEIIEGLNDTHDSIATNRTNETIRILTIIATVMLPVTVVASVFGMNIPLPFMESDYAIFYVFALILAIIGIVLLLLRKLRVI
ncbi:MAG: magnesium transporter CorA family protein [Dehalococcoidales bacterium]|nr:magnesium transporter CorA family protein [Dehalococcoidales bacterium]